MALFKRKLKPKPDRVPEVFVQHDDRAYFTISRFFLTKNWLMKAPEPIPKEGEAIILPSRELLSSLELLPSRADYLELRKQLFDAVPVMGEDPTTDMIRIYPQYLAIQWGYLMLPDGQHLDEVAGQIEEHVVAILGVYFGWEQPLVGHFSSDSDRHATEQRLNASWSFGSYSTRPWRSRSM